MACHPSAVAGFAEGNIESYEHGRPEYSDADVELLLRSSGALAGATADSAGRFPAEPILELACGTGKFTRPLLRALEIAGGSGCHAHVTLVDPAGMGSHAARQFPGLRFECTTADKLGHFPDGCFRAVVAAQAFHWFADEPSLAEIWRVLRPGGSLLLIWNTRDRAASPLMGDLEALLDESYVAAGATPRHNTGEWRRVFETPAVRASWSPLQETRVPRQYAGSVEAFVDWMLSVSVVSKRDADVKAAIALRTRALLAEHSEAKVLHAAADSAAQAAGHDDQELYSVPLFSDLAWVQKRDGVV
jgi:ubiquinone/menaquinone biosynthesis C-methylase UbiE